MANETGDEKAKAKAAKGAKAEADKAAKAETDKLAAEEVWQDHVVTREVMHDGEMYVAGNAIALTRKQHAQLHAVGAVESDWRD